MLTPLDQDSRRAVLPLADGTLRQKCVDYPKGEKADRMSTPEACPGMKRIAIIFYFSTVLVFAAAHIVSV